MANFIKYEPSVLSNMCIDVHGELDGKPFVRTIAPIPGSNIYSEWFKTAIIKFAENTTIDDIRKEV